MLFFFCCCLYSELLLLKINHFGFFLTCVSIREPVVVGESYYSLFENHKLLQRCSSCKLIHGEVYWGEE